MGRGIGMRNPGVHLGMHGANCKGELQTRCRLQMTRRLRVRLQFAVQLHFQFALRAPHAYAHLVQPEPVVCHGAMRVARSAGLAQGGCKAEMAEVCRAARAQKPRRRVCTCVEECCRVRLWEGTAGVMVEAGSWVVGK